MALTVSIVPSSLLREKLGDLSKRQLLPLSDPLTVLRERERERERARARERERERERVIESERERTLLLRT